MPTTFDEVFEIYLDRIDSYSLVGLTDDEIKEDMIGKLKRAKARFRSANDITLDLVNKQFNRELEDIEKDILALWMVTEWVKPKLFCQDNMETHMTAKEFASTGGAPLLERLRGIKKDADREANLYTTRYGHMKKKKKSDI